MADLLIASDANEKQIPNVELSNRIYVVEQKRKQKLDADDLLKSIVDDINGDDMADVYVQVMDKFGLMKDEELVATMMAKNKTVIEEIETKIADAIQNAGDTEVCHKEHNILLSCRLSQRTQYPFFLLIIILPILFMTGLMVPSLYIGH